MSDWLSMFDYGFMQYALLAVCLIMPLFALLGTMVVNNGMSFFSDALGHSALTGVGIGVLFGMTDPTLPMIVFAVVFALLMNYVYHAGGARADTVIGVFSSCGVALGLVLLSRTGNYQNYQSLLIGDVLNVTASQLWLLGGTLLVTAVVWLLCFNRFLAVSISPALSKSRGIAVAWYDNLFAVAVAVIVMISIRIVGLLIINAMLILPAAAARNVARSMRSYHVLALVFGLFSGVLGLVLSYMNAVATGPMIVLCAAAVFFGTLWLSPKRKA